MLDERLNRYWAYLRAAGGLGTGLALASTLCAAQALTILVTFWLVRWAEASKRRLAASIPYWAVIIAFMVGPLGGDQTVPGGVKPPLPNMVNAELVQTG